MKHPGYVTLLFLVSVLLFLMEGRARAQFQKEAFNQTYTQVDSTASPDTSNKIINFKEIIGGLTHKRTMRIGSMFGTSVILPGTAQIYNEEYWKLPVFYGGMTAGITGGCIMLSQYNKTGNSGQQLASTLCFAGAGIFYYASMMDGVVSYKSDRNPLAGRATVYSILCPGLGQAYNGEYWKIPIYVGGLATAAHFYASNRINYVRYRDIYREVSQPGYSGESPINATQAKYYRDMYRRYKDYSMLAIGIVYLLQIIDANVFCYMNDFEVSQDISMHITPSITLPEGNSYAFTAAQPAVGATLGIRF